jgi:hypothetical protein
VQLGKRVQPDSIVDHYLNLERSPKPRLDIPLELVTLTNTGHGLGDTVVLTDLPRAAAARGEVASVFSQSPHFAALMKFNPHFEERVFPFWAAADRLVAVFDLGNGHTVQRLRRAFGYDVDDKPSGCLVLPPQMRGDRRFAVHFEAGRHAEWQREQVHSRARQVYPESLAAIQRFVRAHPEYEFFEVGRTRAGLDGVADATGLALPDTMALMASCGYFIGIISGPLHVAAALGLRLITIVNFPEPRTVVLPTLKDVGVIESEWLYPQSVILHQEGAGGTVAAFGLDSLEAAVAGEVYPYWSDDYLPLIHTAM